MGNIKLKRANVVKEVDSEDRAKALEAKGFVRTDGKSAKAPAGKGDTDKLQKELAETKEKLQAAEAAEKELESVKAQLQDAEKKAQALETELEGTKEQLEAAVKQNKAAGKK